MQAIEIKELRAKLGLTQEEMARVVGVAYPTIGRWESGKYKPSRLAVDRLLQLQKGKK